jgi:hypothetical protein
MPYTKNQIQATVKYVSDQYFSEHQSKVKLQPWFEKQLKQAITIVAKLHLPKIDLQDNHFRQFHSNLANKDIFLSEESRVILKRTGESIDYRTNQDVRTIFPSAKAKKSLAHEMRELKKFFALLTLERDEDIYLPTPQPDVKSVSFEEEEIYSQAEGDDDLDDDFEKESELATVDQPMFDDVDEAQVSDEDQGYDDDQGYEQDQDGIYSDQSSRSSSSSSSPAPSDDEEEQFDMIAFRLAKSKGHQRYWRELIDKGHVDKPNGKRVFKL